MRIFVAVNQVNEIGYRQTTALLIASLVRRGCEVHLVNVDAFSFQGNSDECWFFAEAIAIEPRVDCDSNRIESLANGPSIPTRIKIRSDDLILIRTNPGRDLERTMVHETFLGFCQSAKGVGIRVVNDPTSLRFFGSKAALAMVDPAFRPVMLVSHQSDLVLEFIRSNNRDSVIKPLHGSRGQDVIRVSPDQEGLEQLIDRTFGGRGVVVQRFVDSVHPGDQRVVVVGGQVLEVEGHIAGIMRIPADGDFRANLHAGGTAQPVQLSESARRAGEHAAVILNEHGIWLAGIDLIEDQIIEFNVFSTGGLYDANRFSKIDFSDEIADRLISQI